MVLSLLCATVLYGVVWYGIVWYGVVWCGVVWYGMVWYGMVWYGMVWYGMVWYGMVWYGMVWYGMVWYGMRYLLNHNHSVIMHLPLHDGMHVSQKYPQVFRTVSIRNNYSELKQKKDESNFIFPIHL